MLRLDGSDYTAIVPRTLTFDRNNLEFPIAINIIDDQVHELSEDFFGRLSSSDGDVFLMFQQTRIRIEDNDGMMAYSVAYKAKRVTVILCLLCYCSCDVYVSSACVHVHGGRRDGKSVR